jgi:hypothetical protein
MKPLDYINFKKEDFIFNCITDNGFSDVQANDIFRLICNYIEKLQNVRHSKTLTKAIISEIIQHSEHPRWEGSYWSDIKYNFIINWLLKALWEDRGSYYSKLVLSQYCNRKEGFIVYDIDKEFVSDSDLLKILEIETSTKRYETKDPNLIKEVFEICNVDFFEEVEFLVFRECVETANFRDLKIKKNKMQYLTYLLSHHLGDDWYSDVCKTMKWGKSRCSGQGSKVKEYPKVSKLIKLLSNQKKG